MLINKRKFDIRCYSLITSINGNLKGFFFRDGYLRTSSKEFSIKILNSKVIHLTNEAVQKNYEDFGKFEPGNKLTFIDFQKYLDQNFSDLNISFKDHILPQIRYYITLCIKSVKHVLDPKGKKHTFEVMMNRYLVLIL